MSVRISCGQYAMHSRRQPNNNGVCEWNELVGEGGLELMGYPEDPDQVPDVFVHLIKGESSSGVACSFARFKFSELYKDGKGFDVEPRWIVLQKDKHLSQYSDDTFPGSILLQLGAGDAEHWEAAASAWKDKITTMQHRTPYELRVHIYQGRHLPATDFNGLCDPYIKVNFNGLEGRETERQNKTCDPKFYTTITFDCALPAIEYAPQINLQVWDHDLPPKSPDYIGCFNYELKNAELSRPADLDEGSPPDPKWFQLMREQPGDSEGEILASFELIPKDTPDQELAKSPRLKPTTTKATVEIIALGMRNMQPYQFMGMSLPFMEFEIDAGDGQVEVARTAGKKYPRPDNPNYLERILMQVELPENPTFSPSLKVVARDIRLGGLSQPIVGVGRIDLEKKCPWSDDYEPPGTRWFPMSRTRRRDRGEAGVERQVRRRGRCPGRGCEHGGHWGRRESRRGGRRAETRSARAARGLSSRNQPSLGRPGHGRGRVRRAAAHGRAGGRAEEETEE